MSKIYEALLRAEIDRITAAGTQPTGPVATLAKDEAVSAKPESISPSIAAVLPPIPEAPEPNEKVRSFANAQSEYEAASALIPANRWKLALQQLPSIQEQGSAVEQFRSLRSRMYEFRSLNTLKTLLISSGLPEEGKSFIAVNLAISLARHKSSRVLLIDGDMRRGTLHKLLGAPSVPGLTEFLSGKANLGQALQRAKPNDDKTPLPPGIGLLHFMASGGDAENAADLSGNARFAELISTVAPMYDWIIVDSSPVNLIADGINLARSCDGVLLVTRGGVTKFQVAQRALQELKASNVIGVVLNAVQKPPTAAGYYGYDAYETTKE